MIRLLGILLLVATTTWPHPAAVLCIVPGGHVAIEPGPERCDTSAGAPHDGESAHGVLEPGETCCAPCTDVPLGTPAMGGPGRPDDHLQVLTEAAGQAPAILPAIADPGCSCAPAMPRPGRDIVRHSPAILHGTIILRC